MKDFEKLVSKAMEGYVEPKWFHVSDKHGWRSLKDHPELKDDII